MGDYNFYKEEAGRGSRGRGVSGVGPTGSCFFVQYSVLFWQAQASVAVEPGL